MVARYRFRMTSPHIEITAAGRIDTQDSAFPKAIALPNGDLLCSYSNAGGAYATGGTGPVPLHRRRALLDSARRTSCPWARTRRRATSSSSAGARTDRDACTPTGRDPRTSTGWCSGRGRRPRSCAPRRDDGRTWSAPSSDVPMPTDMLEVSDAALVLPVRATDRAGGDGGSGPAGRARGGRRSPTMAAGRGRGAVDVLQATPRVRLGYLEQKLVDLGDGRLLATAWTVTMDDLADQTEQPRRVVRRGLDLDRRPARSGRAARRSLR